jgi:hypothetical protein
MADSPPGVDLLARFLLEPGIPSPTATAVDCLTNLPITVIGVMENPPGSGRYIGTIGGADIPAPTRVRVTLNMTGGLPAAQVHYQIGPIGARTQKRPAIRQRILGRLYDEERLPGFTCTVTSADVSGGTADPMAIGGEGEFRGFVVWFQDGRNMLAERLVTGYTTSTRRVDWTPPLPLAPYPGEHFELSPMRVTRLNRAIDDVLQELRDQWLRPASDTTITTNGTATSWPLPEDFRIVGRVGMVDQVSGRLVSWLSPSQWTIGPNRTLRLTGGCGSMEPDPMGWGERVMAAPLPSGLRLQVEGHVALPPVVDDEQYIDAPVEALVDTAALALAEGMERHRPVLPFMAQRANRSRALAQTHVGTVARSVGT